MANFNITPVGGVDLDYVSPDLPVNRAINLGTIVKAKDGHDYVFAKAGGAQIAASTATALTEATWTMAAGAGAWTTQAVAVPAANYAWFKKTAI